MSTAANGNAQKVLDAMGRRIGRMPVRDLAEDSGLTTRQVTDAFRHCLIPRGLARRLWLGVYTLTLEGYEALGGGDILKSGPKGPRPEMPACSMRSRLWRALRLKGHGTLRDLLVLASRGAENTDDARHYLGALSRTAYVVREGTPEAPIYCLARNTGPLAPLWNKAKKRVHDPNTGETHALA